MLASACLSALADERPHPRDNPAAPLMLAGDWVPADPHQIDFQQLPRIPSQHVVVNSVRIEGSDPTKVDKHGGGVNQHNYLAFAHGRYWIMWSDGPGVEDRVGQRVKFATSDDGFTWSPGEFLTPEPPHSGPDSKFYGTRTDQGFRWIARGFWIRNQQLLALASLDEAAGFFGPTLALHAFQWRPDQQDWQPLGVIAENAINNFSPEALPGGEWMMSRRTHDYKKTGVHFLIGGKQAITEWESIPVHGSNGDLVAEEPLWWSLPDQSLMALFRDNRRSGFLYRSFSTDNGRTWSRPARTNFPDATSKIHGLRLNDGRYVLVSNSNPRQRDPLTIAISTDGLVFHQLGVLVSGRHIDYPHVLEHNGQLLVAFAGGKQSVELLRINVNDLTTTLNSAQPPSK